MAVSQPQFRIFAQARTLALGCSFQKPDIYIHKYRMVDQSKGWRIQRRHGKRRLTGEMAPILSSSTSEIHNCRRADSESLSMSDGKEAIDWYGNWDSVSGTHAESWPLWYSPNIRSPETVRVTPLLGQGLPGTETTALRFRFCALCDHLAPIYFCI